MSQAHVSMTGRSGYSAAPRPENKLELWITNEVKSDLENMSEELGFSIGATIQKAITLLKIVLTAKSKGCRIVMVNDRENTERNIEI